MNSLEIYNSIQTILENVKMGDFLRNDAMEKFMKDPIPDYKYSLKNKKKNDFNVSEIIIKDTAIAVNSTNFNFNNIQIYCTFCIISRTSINDSLEEMEKLLQDASNTNYSDRSVFLNNYGGTFDTFYFHTAYRLDLIQISIKRQEKQFKYCHPKTPFIGNSASWLFQDRLDHLKERLNSILRIWRLIERIITIIKGLIATGTFIFLGYYFRIPIINTLVNATISGYLSQYNMPALEQFLVRNDVVGYFNQPQNLGG